MYSPSRFGIWSKMAMGERASPAPHRHSPSLRVNSSLVCSASVEAFSVRFGRNTRGLRSALQPTRSEWNPPLTQARRRPAPIGPQRCCRPVCAQVTSRAGPPARASRAGTTERGDDGTATRWSSLRGPVLDRARHVASESAKLRACVPTGTEVTLDAPPHRAHERTLPRCRSADNGLMTTPASGISRRKWAGAYGKSRTEIALSRPPEMAYSRLARAGGRET
jgi:hypothetical protein